MDNKKKYILFGGIALGVGVFSYFLFKKIFGSDMEDNENINIEEGNTVEKRGELIFSKPKTKMKYPLLYIFGGMDYANPKWMLEQTPKYLLSRSFIVFAPYTTKYSTVKSSAEKYFADNNIDINEDKISLMGFSAGGLDVQENYNQNLKYAGLIDPSTRASYLDLPFSKNVIMVYNDRNWGAYPSIQSTLPKLDNVVKEKGGIAERVSLQHSKIPAYFLSKYQNKFL